MIFISLIRSSDLISVAQVDELAHLRKQILVHVETDIGEGVSGQSLNTLRKDAHSLHNGGQIELLVREIINGVGDKDLDHSSQVLLVLHLLSFLGEKHKLRKVNALLLILLPKHFVKLSLFSILGYEVDIILDICGVGVTHQLKEVKEHHFDHILL